MSKNDISVYDFDEEDTKPYYGKQYSDKESKKTFFERSFVPQKKPAKKHPKRQSVSVISGKPHKRSGRQSKKVVKNGSQRIVASQEARENSPESIEMDNSNSIFERDTLGNAHLRNGGTSDFENSATVHHDIDKEIVETNHKQIIIDGIHLLISKRSYMLPKFVFTADTITLDISIGDSRCVIRWQSHEIQSLRSCENKEHGCIRIDLYESGQRTLKEQLNFDSNLTSSTLFALTSIVDGQWHEQIRRLTSISDFYKSIWGPEKKEKIDELYQTLRNLSPLDSLDHWVDIVFPKDDPDAVTVTRYDYWLLSPDQFLSDTIIDFYIKYLQTQLSEQNKERFYFFNSFFFRKLTDTEKSLPSEKSLYQRLKRWTSRVDIFEKDYLFIPILQSAHWSLVIVCHPRYLSAGDSESPENEKVPVILHLDSLEGSHTGIERSIKTYLLEAWWEKKSESPERLPVIEFVGAKVPQQTNYSDCGLFLLHFVDLFIKGICESDSLDFVSCEWFDPGDASKKREDIKRLLECMQEDDDLVVGISKHGNTQNDIELPYSNVSMLENDNMVMGISKYPNAHNNVELPNSNACIGENDSVVTGISKDPNAPNDVGLSDSNACMEEDDSVVIGILKQPNAADDAELPNSNCCMEENAELPNSNCCIGILKHPNASNDVDLIDSNVCTVCEDKQGLHCSELDPFDCAGGPLSLQAEGTSGDPDLELEEDNHIVLEEYDHIELEEDDHSLENCDEYTAVNYITDIPPKVVRDQNIEGPNSYIFCYLNPETHQRFFLSEEGRAQSPTLEDQVHLSRKQDDRSPISATKDELTLIPSRTHQDTEDAIKEEYTLPAMTDEQPEEKSMDTRQYRKQESPSDNTHYISSDDATEEKKPEHERQCKRNRSKGHAKRCQTRATRKCDEVDKKSNKKDTVVEIV